MADRDMVNCIDEGQVNVYHTPNRRLKMEHLSRSRQKNVRKTGKLRVLYTPKDTLDLEDNVRILPEPHSKGLRLSSAPCTITSGDVVDVTSGNLKVALKPMQQHKIAHTLFNNYTMEGLSTTGSSETQAVGQNPVNVLDKAKTTDRKKLAQLIQISELTWTSHRAEQGASTHKPQHLNEEEDEHPATQPVSSQLLKGQYKQVYNLKFTSVL